MVVLDIQKILTQENRDKEKAYVVSDITHICYFNNKLDPALAFVSDTKPNIFLKSTGNVARFTVKDNQNYIYRDNIYPSPKEVSENFPNDNITCVERGDQTKVRLDDIFVATKWRDKKKTLYKRQSPKYRSSFTVNLPYLMHNVYVCKDCN